MICKCRSSRNSEVSKEGKKIQMHRNNGTAVGSMQGAGVYWTQKHQEPIGLIRICKDFLESCLWVGA